MSARAPESARVPVVTAAPVDATVTTGPPATWTHLKATHGQTRTHNSRLVLRTIYDRTSISRAEVARVTGLTRTSVSELAGELLDAGLVQEVGRGPSTGGKAPILLRVVPDARLVVGVDVAETELRGALVDLRGDIHRTRILPLGSRDADAVLDQVHDLVGGLIDGADRPILGIGIATPGLVEPATGTVRWSVHLDWRDLPLGPILAARHGLPTHVANDSQAAALAQYTFGADRGIANQVVVKVGQGIGAGIIIDGSLFVGDHSGAGEIGHTSAGDDDIVCRCGRSGCLETFASSRGLVLRARRVAESDPDSALARIAEERGVFDLEVVIRALAAGDEAARRIVEEAGRMLGAAIAALVGTLDIESIVLVGSVAGLGDGWLAAVREEVSRRALPLLAGRTRVDVGLLSPDIVVLGASAMLLTRELGLALAR